MIGYKIDPSLKSDSREFQDACGDAWHAHYDPLFEESRRAHLRNVRHDRIMKIALGIVFAILGCQAAYELIYILNH